MKKRKTYEVSVINKTYSKTYSDQTKFYTSDTALELNFQLKEVEYDFDSAEIILLNVDDRSLVTRPVTKSAEGFIYELEDDIVTHYGEWKGQLKFNEGGEIYVSSPVVFRIENDLSNDRPPQLVDVNNWTRLKQSANDLIADMQLAIADADKAEQSRQQAESDRVTAESQRQSAELLRIENENQRNLTSVEEFTKLQDAIGGRNLVPDSDFTTGTGGWVGYYGSLSNVDGEVLKFTANGDSASVARIEYSFTMAKSGIYTLTMKVKATSPIMFRNFIGATLSNGNVTDTGNVWTTMTTKFTVDNDNTAIRFRLYLQTAVAGSNIEVDWFKVEKGEESTPYTKAPEDYTTVSKEDYYNHVELMNNYRDIMLAGKANKKQEDWLYPTVTNGTADTSSTPSFHKDEFGIVHLTGRVNNLTGTRQTLFTLPTGYRPYAGQSYPCISGGGSFGFASIANSGAVTFTAGNTLYVCLDGITFKAER